MSKFKRANITSRASTSVFIIIKITLECFIAHFISYRKSFYLNNNVYASDSTRVRVVVDISAIFLF